MLEKLSADCEVVAATVEEHVMVSSAECWRSGRRLWSVAHDSQSSADHLVESGSPPASFQAIKDRLFAAQSKEKADDPMRVDHLFDAPLELAESLTGFKHDKEVEAKFEVLKKKAPDGFFARLFAKR